MLAKVQHIYQYLFLILKSQWLIALSLKIQIQYKNAIIINYIFLFQLLFLAYVYNDLLQQQLQTYFTWTFFNIWSSSLKNNTFYFTKDLFWNVYWRLNVYVLII